MPKRSTAGTRLVAVFGSYLEHPTSNGVVGGFPISPALRGIQGARLSPDWTRTAQVGDQHRLFCVGSPFAADRTNAASSFCGNGRKRCAGSRGVGYLRARVAGDVGSILGDATQIVRVFVWEKFCVK